MKGWQQKAFGGAAVILLWIVLQFGQDWTASQPKVQGMLKQISEQHVAPLIPLIFAWLLAFIWPKPGLPIPVGAEKPQTIDVEELRSIAQQNYESAIAYQRLSERLETRQSILRLSFFAMIAFALAGMVCNWLTPRAQRDVAIDLATYAPSFWAYLVSYSIAGLIAGLAVHFVKAKTKWRHGLRVAGLSAMFVNLCGFLFAIPFLLNAYSKPNFLVPGTDWVWYFVPVLFVVRVVIVPLVAAASGAIGFLAGSLFKPDEAPGD